MKKLFLIFPKWSLPYFTLMSITTFLGYLASVKFGELGTDKYFHFAFSRMMNEGKWFINQLPQMVGLGWDEYFPDKEFLFHQLTGIGYFIGGDRGVEGICFVLSLGIISALFFVIKKWLKAWIAVLLILSVALFKADFFQRLFLIRPHLLGIFCFILLYGGLLHKKPRLALIGGFLFSLSYHAVYIPIAVLLLFLAVDFWFNRKIAKSFKWGMSGILAGLLFNPYFPTNIWAGFRSLMYSFGALSSSEVGSELLPLTPNQFFLTHSGYLLLFVICGIVLFKKTKGGKLKGLENGEEIFHLFLTFLIFSLFLYSAKKNQRAIEYLAPSAVVMTSLLIAILGKIKKILPALIIMALFGSNLYGMHQKQYMNFEPFKSTELQLALKATKKIPNDEISPKIFNCTYEFGSYIFYFHPTAQFLDFSDPRLYQVIDPIGHEKREKLKRGRDVGPYETLTKHFNADYVICYNEPLLKQLEVDSRFLKVFPKEIEAEAPQVEKSTRLYRIIR